MVLTHNALASAWGLGIEGGFTERLDAVIDKV